MEEFPCDLSGGSTTFNEDSLVTLETPFSFVLEELIENAVWDVCFEVHRAAQHGIIYGDDGKIQYLIVNGSEKKQTSKPKLNLLVICPVCQVTVSALIYASHLNKCIKNGGRNSSINAKKRIAECADDTGSDEDKNDNDFGFIGNKSKYRKYKPKSTKKAGSSITYADVKIMTYEEKMAFFNKKCGVMSKNQPNNMCKNSLKCSAHPEELRTEIRHELLGIREDQLNNEEIDVDTVDERNDQCLFSPSLPTAYKKYM